MKDKELEERIGEYIKELDMLLRDSESIDTVLQAKLGSILDKDQFVYGASSIQREEPEEGIERDLYEIVERFHSVLKERVKLVRRIKL